MGEEAESAAVCPACRKPAERVHIQGFSGEGSLYRGPSASVLRSLGEMAGVGGEPARSASGAELAVGYMENGVHCPACKLVAFRYAI